MRLDAGHDLLHLAADFHLAAEQFLGLGHCLAGDDLPYLELQFLKILKTDFRLGFYVDYVSGRLGAVSRSGSGLIFDIDITLKGAGHSARCRIAGHHTHVVLLERDGHPLINQPPAEEQPEAYATDRSLLNVADIVTFADETPLDGLRELLDRQVSYNMAIAQAGLDQSFGARIGQILLDAYGDTVSNRAKALAAAASDARMNGCGLPVVINSGSGNQGITASVPVVVYARELGVSQTSLYRALIVSNLITIHLKTGIGRLSAYCGAISAGCGAGSGVAYLYGGR